MSFFVYFAVLLVAAASALFGLDLLTSPLPPERPKTQVASTTNSATPTKPEASNKNLKREAKREAARAAANKSANEAALSPVYPAAPGGDASKTETAENTDVRMVYPPTNVTTTGLASADEKEARSTSAERAMAAASNQSATVAAQQQQQQQQQQPQPQQAVQAPSAPEPTVQAAAAATESKAQDEPAATPAPAPKPVAEKAPNSCNISACAAAYRSFRAEDCTYQPYSGPRQVCEKPAGEQERTADRGKSRHAEARVDRATRATHDETKMRDIVRRVKQLTQDEAGDSYDVPLRGRRVIVIERGSGDFWR